MNQSLYKSGKISKAHGHGGALIIIFDRPLDADAEELREIFVKIDGLLVPFPVEDFEIRSDTSACVKLEFVDNSDIASELVGNEVHTETECDDFSSTAEPEYPIGFSVHDMALGNIGIIRQIENYNGNIVLQVMDGEKEKLISLYPELIAKTDYENKILHIVIPDGYFE